MGLYDLPDAIGHSLTTKVRDPKNQWSRYYECTCGAWIYAQKKTDGKADRATNRRWADHIEISGTPADYMEELGKIHMTRSTHTYFLFTTKHPEFSTWDSPTGWMRRQYDEHIAGGANTQWVIGIEKTRKKPPNKKIIHYFYDPKASALAGAFKQIDAGAHKGFKTERAPALQAVGLPSTIQINTISLVDATSDLISRADDVLASGVLGDLIDAQTQIRNFLTLEVLLRHKLREIDTKINETALGRKIA